MTSDEPQEIDLFVPATYDLVWSLVAVLQIALLAMALVVWFRARASNGGNVVDVLVILLLPVVGPAAYLIGRALARRRATA